jgi:hypothetical protein
VRAHLCLCAPDSRTADARHKRRRKELREVATAPCSRRARIKPRAGAASCRTAGLGSPPPIHMRASPSTCPELLHPRRFPLGYLCAAILYPLAPVYIAPLAWCTAPLAKNWPSGCFPPLPIHRLPPVRIAAPMARTHAALTRASCSSCSCRRFATSAPSLAVRSWRTFATAQLVFECLCLVSVSPFSGMRRTGGGCGGAPMCHGDRSQWGDGRGHEKLARRVRRHATLPCCRWLADRP